MARWKTRLITQINMLHVSVKNNDYIDPRHSHGSKRGKSRHTKQTLKVTEQLRKPIQGCWSSWTSAAKLKSARLTDHTMTNTKHTQQTLKTEQTQNLTQIRKVYVHTKPGLLVSLDFNGQAKVCQFDCSSFSFTGQQQVFWLHMEMTESEGNFHFWRACYTEFMSDNIC